MRQGDEFRWQGYAEFTKLIDVGIPEEAFDLIRAEDGRQREKWGVQEHTLYVWLGIATEELGELAQSITEYSFRDGELEDIAKEATHLATLALKIAWMASRG